MDTLKVMAMSGVTAVVVVALLMLSGAFKSDTLGAVPGVNLIPYPQMVIQGGGTNATTTTTSSTLTTSDIDDENVVSMTLTQGSGTLTFPASSSFPGIPNTGDTRMIMVRNATTSASVVLTLAGGTGVKMKVASSTGTTNLQILGDTDGDNNAVILFTRKSNSDIVGNVIKFAD